MRRTIISTVCMAAALALAASCNKIEENTPSVEGYGRSVITAVAETVGGGTFEDNIYPTESEWDAMEAAGAVFIPAAGCRVKDENGKEKIDYYGEISAFWTTTSNIHSNVYQAHRAHMNDDKGTANTLTSNKNDGFPVRLVTEVSE